MIRKLVITATFSFFASGCGAAATSTWKSPDEQWSEPAKAGLAQKTAQKKREVAAEQEPARTTPEVGDFTVQRYSGSFSKNPVTMTEEIIAREGDLMIVDYTLEDGKETLRFRARVDLKSKRVVAASRLEKGSEVEMTLGAYEALMAKTVFTADTNEERLGAETATCLVGGKELDCEVTSYRVTVGGKPAKLSISTSKALTDRDVAGEIKSEDGNVIYRAEIVEVGKRPPSSSVAIAQ
jgi:hypothetical protein